MRRTGLFSTFCKYFQYKFSSFCNGKFIFAILQFLITNCNFLEFLMMYLLEFSSERSKKTHGGGCKYALNGGGTFVTIDHLANTSSFSLKNVFFEVTLPGLRNDNSETLRATCVPNAAVGNARLLHARVVLSSSSSWSQSWEQLEYLLRQRLQRFTGNSGPRFYEDGKNRHGITNFGAFSWLYAALLFPVALNCREWEEAGLHSW